MSSSPLPYHHTSTSQSHSMCKPKKCCNTPQSSCRLGTIALHTPSKNRPLESSLVSRVDS
ncbi:hypothetical protein SCLCIDRAFT_152299 [Scleroderma citrinum Foug A]|uniref:Uncharacterized protein n=1 Tax=Scleroderma citrinum Foug A TaxID=1036808 RepID=A0A0C3ERN4_9AGAM|nr:hypothetical protein SCLCIDRAFT_152299 [Scleroderma citrinum Foug A]